MSWKCPCGTANDDGWSRCIGCNGEFRNEYKIIDIDKPKHIINSENSIGLPIKTEPNYGFALRHRMAGLLFGISISFIVFIVAVKVIRWTELSLFLSKYLLYLIAISGFFGFLLGKRYHKQINAFFELATKKE